MDAPPATIRVEAYDDSWASTFAAEEALLTGVFGDVDAVIEHIGSTAVPGLPAKPIVDVLVGVADLAEVEARVGALDVIGYAYVPEYEAQIPQRRYFRKPRDRPRSVHLHCVERGGAIWRRHLAFRDHLRASPPDAAAYGALKRQLAERHGSDRDAYLAGKAPFIEAVLARAGVDA